MKCAEAPRARGKRRVWWKVPAESGPVQRLDGDGDHRRQREEEDAYDAQQPPPLGACRKQPAWKKPKPAAPPPTAALDGSGARDDEQAFRLQEPASSDEGGRSAPDTTAESRRRQELLNAAATQAVEACAKRREARSQRRLLGYTRQMQPGTVEARLQALRAALAARSKREEEGDTWQKWGAEEWPSTDLRGEQQLLALLESDDDAQESVAASVDALSYHDFYELKKIFFRYMQRVFRSCEVGDAVLRPMDDAAQLKTLRLLVEDVRLPDYGKRSEEAHQNALRYCSALHCGAALTNRTDLRFAVAEALNAVLDDPATRSRWVGGWHSHHVVQACIRVSPRGAGQQLCSHFLEVMGELRPGAETTQPREQRMRALAERMVNTKPGEFMERVLITTIQHVPADAEGAPLLRDVAAELAVEQLRGCVELYEGCETALTLARVMLKYFIAPGWKRVMSVWAEDPAAGQLLRSCHAVAVLLECLEEPSATGNDEDVELFRSLQAAVLSRFERLLAAQPMEQEWYSALGYTLVESDIWSRKPQRARLAKVLRQGVRERLGKELPELRKTALARRSYRSAPLATGDWAAHGRLLLPPARPTGGGRAASRSAPARKAHEEVDQLGRRLLDLMGQTRPPACAVAPDEMLLREELLRGAREAVRRHWRDDYAAPLATMLPVESRTCSPSWAAQQAAPVGLAHSDFMDYMKGSLFRNGFPIVEAVRLHSMLLAQ